MYGDYMDKRWADAEPTHLVIGRAPGIPEPAMVCAGSLGEAQDCARAMAESNWTHVAIMDAETEVETPYRLPWGSRQSGIAR